MKLKSELDPHPPSMRQSIVCDACGTASPPSRCSSCMLTYYWYVYESVFSSYEIFVYRIESGLEYLYIKKNLCIISLIEKKVMKHVLKTIGKFTRHIVKVQQKFCFKVN